MKILSIETSCDDTAITIMEVKGGIKNASFNILANTSNSQIAIHSPYGGVFPALAKREHIKNLPILLDQVLKEANLTKKSSKSQAFLNSQSLALNPGIDLIAVTYGPGLEPALWTGIVFAKELAKKWKVPLMPVNHMEGHILSVFGKSEGKFLIPKIDFPVLSLLVSGGHTELILSKDLIKYKIIGETLDDAAGEAFDKVARMMNLPYPGGPQISKLAEEERNSSSRTVLKEFKKDSPFPAISLPRPMLHSKNFNFSFSGLKTAVLYLIRDLTKKDSNILQNDKIKQAIALEFENAVVETLVYKTIKAQEKYKAKTIIVGGGVACNQHLQREMKKAIAKDINLLFPEKKLTGDNSIMIGMAGYLQFIKKNKKTNKTSNIKANGNLRFK
jgi:N6-L-threonylcarbamoyladenine synthase